MQLQNPLTPVKNGTGPCTQKQTTNKNNNINNIIIIFTKEEKEKKKKKHTQITNKKTVPEPINEPKFRFEIKPPMAIYL